MAQTRQSTVGYSYWSSVAVCIDAGPTTATFVYCLNLPTFRRNLAQYWPCTKPIVTFTMASGSESRRARVRLMDGTLLGQHFCRCWASVGPYLTLHLGCVKSLGFCEYWPIWLIWWPISCFSCFDQFPSLLENWIKIDWKTQFDTNTMKIITLFFYLRYLKKHLPNLTNFSK